ncbi:MFS transporter [Actinomadura roseirufa]|uniref:MFS transporter n=1 Tax=Actinomadura roseirufa TaxID=2094049 RepID=UPI0010413089|nr:MFS transporter [Actinomadura roseirufa]
MTEDVDEAAPRGRSRPWLLVWLLALGMFAIGTDLFIVSGLLPTLGRDLGLSEGAAGQTVTAFAITYAVAAPLLTGAAARADRRALLPGVLLVFAAGNLVSATASSFALLLAGRILTGAAAALFAATASAVAARITPRDRRGRALGIVYAGMTSAIAIGVPLGSAIGNVSSWRWAFGFVVLLSLGTAAGLAACLPPLPGTAAASLRRRLAAARIPHAPTAMLTTTLWVVGTFVVYTYLGTLLDDRTHATPSQRTWLLLLFGVGSFAGVMVGGRLADRLDATRALAGSIIVLAVVLAALEAALRSPAAAGAGLVLWGLVHWASFPLIQHRLITIGGRDSDMLLALNNSAVYLGQTVAAVTGGLLVNAGALGGLPLAGTGFQIAAVAVLAAGAAGHRARARARRQEAPDPVPAKSV